jgi:syntaxin 1B/2/3
MPRCTRRAQEKIATIGKLANDVKTKLEDLNKQNELAKKKPGCGEGSASERTRTTITSGLKRKLKDIMVQYNDIRDKIHAENRTLVEKRIYTVTRAYLRASGAGGQGTRGQR